MQLHRIGVKFYVKDPAAVDLDAFIPLFHRWIQQRRMDRLLIDVADYRHVPEGPGVLLIGDACDYAMDLGQGRPGLLYTLKRLPDGELAAQLRTLVREALEGCRLIEADEALEGRVRFAGGAWRLTLVDRLRGPNTAEAFERFRPEIEALAAQLHGEAVVVERAEQDPRAMLGFEVRRSAEEPLERLLERLEAVGTAR